MGQQVPSTKHATANPKHQAPNSKQTAKNKDNKQIAGDVEVFSFVVCSIRRLSIV
jgi:hypothetical protein